MQPLSKVFVLIRSHRRLLMIRHLTLALAAALFCSVAQEGPTFGGL